MTAWKRTLRFLFSTANVASASVQASALTSNAGLVAFLLLALALNASRRQHGAAGPNQTF